MRKKIRYILRNTLDLLFPISCAVCKQNGYALCPTCMAMIQPLTPSVCQRCSSTLSALGLCVRCQFQPLRLNGLSAMGGYQGVLRSCIHALKYAGKTRLAEPLGASLAQTYRARNLQADVIMPVPLHPARQRLRGYNQAQLLAEVCSHELGIAVNTTFLMRARATPAQVQLSRQERLQNMVGAFMRNPTLDSGVISRCNILLIDDVCTTGATLEACAAPLFAAGVSSVWGLVLARA